MENKLSYGDLIELIDRATERLGKKHHLNEGKFCRLHMVNNLANKVAAELECDRAEAFVDEQEKSLNIMFTCVCVYIGDIVDSSLFKLARMVDTMVFSTTKEHDLQINFVIKELWEG